MDNLSLLKLVSQIPNIKNQLENLTNVEDLNKIKTINVKASDWIEENNNYIVNINHNLNTKNLIYIIYDVNDNILNINVSIVDENTIKLKYGSNVDCKIVIPYSIVSEALPSSEILKNISLSEDGKLQYNGDKIMLSSDMAAWSDEEVAQFITTLWS